MQAKGRRGVQHTSTLQAQVGRVRNNCHFILSGLFKYGDHGTGTGGEEKKKKRKGEKL